MSTVPDDGERILFGCVVENRPRDLSRASRLVRSLRWNGGRHAEADFRLWVLDDVDEAYVEEFARHGAEVRIVARRHGDGERPHKLDGLLAEDLDDFEQVVLLDCDALVVGDLEPHVTMQGLRARAAEPPDSGEGALSALARDLGLTDDRDVRRLDAGVVMLDAASRRVLLPAWRACDERLAAHSGGLPEGVGREEAGLALAAAATDVDSHDLPPSMNFPAHEVAGEASQVGEPRIVRYGERVDVSGYVEDSPFPLINERIREINRRVREERRERFENRRFWDLRYAEHAALGSGVGSREALASYKRCLLRAIVGWVRPSNVLDVGCGDMQVSRALPADGYVGFDISPVVVERNRERYPDRRFDSGNFVEADPLPADLVVCLDVLIHQRTAEAYRALVEKLAGCARKALVVSGYEKSPRGTPDIVFFHEPLTTTLDRAGLGCVEPLGEYKQASLYLAAREPVFRSAPGRFLARARVRGCEAWLLLLRALYYPRRRLRRLTDRAGDPPV